MTELKSAQEARHGVCRAVDEGTDGTLGTWPDTPLARLWAVRWLRALEPEPGCRVSLKSPDGFEDASREDAPDGTIFEIRGPTYRDCSPLATAHEAEWMAAHEVDGYSSEAEG